MNLHLVRLNSCSIKDSELSKEITELKSCPLLQRTLTLLGQSEVIHLANSKVSEVGVYFANLENHETMTWIVFIVDWSRTKPGYLCLRLISNRLYQYGAEQVHSG